MNDTPALDQRSAGLIDELLWLGHHAQQRLDLGGVDDYWYVLGERNTYARAAALVAAPHLGEDSAVIAERVEDALSTSAPTREEGDIARLRSAAFGTSDPPATRASSRLEWVGPRAFDAQYGDVPGADRDFGMRWGPAGNQRLSLRREPDTPDTPDAPVGMLYAYDPTWDEYALLQRRIPESVVGAVVLEALKRDAHLPVEGFARLLEAHRDLRTRALPSNLTSKITARPTASPTVSPRTWVLEP